MLSAVVEQTPPTHVATRQTGGVGHAKQITPFVPQLSIVGGVMHGPVAVSQHPFGQLVLLQTHWPCPLQVVPEGQVVTQVPAFCPVPQVRQRFGLHVEAHT